MTTYHFLIGKGALKIKISVPGHNAVDALAKVVNFFNGATILDVYAGGSEGKTSFPELKGKPLFIQPKRSNPFADAPALIVEEEAEMQPTSVEIASK